MYYEYFFFSVPVAILLIFTLTKISHKINLKDIPDQRKIHNSEVPLVGGLALYMTLLAGMCLFPVTERFFWVIITAGSLVTLGAIDDAYGLGVRIRLAVQTMASISVAFSADLWIQSIGIDYQYLDALPKWLGLSLAALAIVSLTNSLNMVDGIDGLAAGHFLVAIGSLWFSMYCSNGVIDAPSWLVILIVSTCIFLAINLSLTPMQQVFLGDAGSLFLGFILGCILIIFSQGPGALVNPVAALWCVSLPIFDAVLVVVGRLKNKCSPFAPDRSHLHHRLVDAGLSHKKALILIMVITIAFNLAGILSVYAVSPLFSFGLFFSCVMGCCVVAMHPKQSRRLTLLIMEKWVRL